MWFHNLKVVCREPAMAYLRATFLRVHLYFKTSFLVSQKEEQDSKTRLSIRGRQEFLNEVD